MRRIRWFNSLSLYVSLVLALGACASGGPRGASLDGSILGRDANVDGEAPLDLGVLLDAEPPRDLGVGVDLGLCDDADGDGFPRGAGCPAAMDCDDTNAAVNPGGAELCNGIDDDCDGSIDEDFGGATSCGVGACLRTVSSCAGGTTGACTPGTPGVETCNGLDDDCDGAIDEDLPALICGVGGCERTVARCSGGAPQTCVPGSSSAEVCNGADDDCDGVIDNGVCGPVVPPNDTCAGASLLTGASGTRSDTLLGATANTTDCGLSGVEVFYRVDVSVASLIYLDTFGTGFDTNISYRGTSCPGSALLCEDDDCLVLQDQLVAVVAAGTHYFAVHTHASYVTPGPISVRWQVMTAAAGSNTRITATGNFSGATSGASAISPACGSTGGAENGYHWTQCLGSTHSISVDTCTSSFDTLLQLRGPTGDIACNDDGCGYPASQLSAVATSGVGLFQVVVDGFSSSSSGSYTLAVTSL